MTRQTKQAQNNRGFPPDEFDYLGQQTPGGRFVSPGEMTPEEMEEFDYLGERTPEGEFVPAEGDEPLPPVEAPPQGAPGPAWTDIRPSTEYTFLPFAPIPDARPVDPATLVDVGDEIEIPQTPIELANKELNVREKIFYSLNNATPLRLDYITIDGNSRTERTVHPDYVYWAGTNRHILVAWDELRDDWRAFSVDNIKRAQLLDDEEPTGTITVPGDIGDTNV